MDSESGVFAMAFDQSGSRLITCDADKTIKIYKEDDSAVSITKVTQNQNCINRAQNDFFFFIILFRDLCWNFLFWWLIILFLVFCQILIHFQVM